MDDSWTTRQTYMLRAKIAVEPLFVVDRCEHQRDIFWNSRQPCLFKAPTKMQFWVYPQNVFPPAVVLNLYTFLRIVYVLNVL